MNFDLDPTLSLQLQVLSAFYYNNILQQAQNLASLSSNLSSTNQLPQLLNYINTPEISRYLLRTILGNQTPDANLSQSANNNQANSLKTFSSYLQQDSDRVKTNTVKTKSIFSVKKNLEDENSKNDSAYKNLLQSHNLGFNSSDIAEIYNSGINSINYNQIFNNPGIVCVNLNLFSRM